MIKICDRCGDQLDKKDMKNSLGVENTPDLCGICFSLYRKFMLDK